MPLGSVWPLAALWAAASALLAPVAAAQPATASAAAVLSLERGAGAEACMDVEQLRMSVEKKLRRPVFVTARPDLAATRVRVRFSRHGQEFRAQIGLSGADGAARGERRLVTSAAHCSALDDALALSVALLVDTPPESAPPLPRAAAGRVSPITIPPEASAPREPWHVALTPGLRTGFGALPGLAFGASLGIRLKPAAFPAILLETDLWLARDAARDVSSGARFGLRRAGLFLCPALGSSRRHVGFCVGQQTGWLEVEGYGFDRNLRSGRLTYSLSARGEGRVLVVAPVSLRGFFGVEVPLVRDRFASAGPHALELFRPGLLAILAGIGGEVALW